MASIINSTDTGGGGLITTGDSSDELQLQTAETARVTLTNTAVVVNEDGNDLDFRVESDTVENAFFLDGATGHIGIGKIPGTRILDVAGEGQSGANNADITWSTTSSGYAPTVNLKKSNGSKASPTVVASGDQVGALLFAGYDGSNYISTAYIESRVDGTPGTNDMPGRLVFFTTADSSASPTERMRITSDGYLRMASGTGGIQFGGDTAAANALDDYEEGEFTPTISSGVTGFTYAQNKGQYVKIGKLVSITMRVNITSGTLSANPLQFTGLPFTCANDYNFLYPVSSGYYYVASNGTNGVSIIVPGTTNIDVYYQTATGLAAFTGNDYGASATEGDIVLSISYRTT